MTIKDFTVGQTAYMVSYIKNEYRLTEWTVAKVGRRYVTAGYVHGCQFYVPDVAYEEFLVEKTEFGYPRLLFATRQEAEDYLEKRVLWQDLRHRFSTTAVGKFTLAQLRAVKQIIDGEESA